MASGALYVRKYFNEEARQNAIEMVADIRTEFEDILKKVDWMDEETKQNALDKAKSMATHIAYPDELLDNKKLEDFYQSVWNFVFCLAIFSYINNVLCLAGIEPKSLPEIHFEFDIVWNQVFFPTFATTGEQNGMADAWSTCGC